MKDKLTIEEIINLENWLLVGNYPTNLTDNELIEYLLPKFNYDEIDYLRGAYRMPLQEIQEELKKYDSDPIKPSELTFFIELQKKFQESYAAISTRVKYAREIMKYLNQTNQQLSEIQKYDKLVRDNIPDIIKKDGQTPIYTTLTDEEYWQYLLKKDEEELQEVKDAQTKEARKQEIIDKLEIVRAMAEFNGYSLEEIITGANIKKEQNGGFKKRILLKKVVKE